MSGLRKNLPISSLTTATTRMRQGLVNCVGPAALCPVDRSDSHVQYLDLGFLKNEFVTKSLFAVQKSISFSPLAAVTGRSWPTEGRLGKAGDAATLTKWSHNPMMSLSRRSTRRYIKCRLITSPSSPPSPLRESGLDPRSYRKDTSNEKPTCCFASRNFSQKLQEGHL
ncbi:hypothetical protein RRG08_046830 [Elysia crispata]|uniref:Uncharacterized protein n=1 Tax=Elysia crispata TaxID=231223 RepID=A0AAE1DIR6_9GAST|nr:hypothetical protein RRG08_046830 [Elysia crispata]